MDLLVIFGGILGLVIIVALIAAIATVVSATGVISEEDSEE